LTHEDFVVYVLANAFSPAVAIGLFEPHAVGFVEVEGDTAQGFIGADWHQS
jgi:hypothetical protein